MLLNVPHRNTNMFFWFLISKLSHTLWNISFAPCSTGLVCGRIKRELSPILNFKAMSRGLSQMCWYIFSL
jgi:hypothetical protein